MAAVVPHSIELHDSCLAAVEAIENRLVICFEPAYIHRDGKGWLQKARLVLEPGEAKTSLVGVPGMVLDGSLMTETESIENFVPLPLQVEGLVSLRLLLRTGQEIVFTGESVRAELLGAPRFVEHVV